MLRLAFGAHVPRIKQHDVTDCGAACLYSIARHYGKRLPLARIRQLASTDRRGTTLLGLAEAAVDLGFLAKGVKGAVESLPMVPLPAIAHVTTSGSLLHYVVLYRVSPTHASVMDPSDGRCHRLGLADFAGRWTGVLLLVAPGQAFATGSLETSLPRRLWHLAWPHKRVMAQAFVGAVAYTLLGLATAIYVQKVVDHALPDSDAYLLHVMSAIMLAVVGAQALIGWSKNVLVLRTGQQIDAALILGYYRHLLRLPHRFFDTMRVGEILSRINDAVKIRAFINDVALDLLVSLLVMLFSFGLMLVYSPLLAVTLLAAVPLYASIYLLTNRLNRRTERETMERAADLEGHLVESIGAIATIKRFGIERRAEWLTETSFVRLLRAVYRSGLTSIGSSEATGIVSRVATVTLFWAGGLFVMAQRLTPGELMSFYALLGYLIGPTASLIGSNRTIQNALIAADRLFEIMDLELDARPRPAELRGSSLGDIVFRGVSFRYGSRTRVFTGLDLTIHRGEATAIVGPSGCGKSTVAAIIQRMYPVDGGQVRIGVHDLRDVSEESLRSMVGVVPQKVELFSGTVLENLALGDPAPDLQRLAEICEATGMREFLDGLPDGLQAQIGENGVELSGGQRQRIAIVRALYRDPQILILDEAASALDSFAEARLRTVLRQLRSTGRTVVMIAHRLSGITWADRVLVLDGGVVVEAGSHEALLAVGGIYQRLWMSQFPDLEDARPPVPRGSGGMPDLPGPAWLGSI